MEQRLTVPFGTSLSWWSGRSWPPRIVPSGCCTGWSAASCACSRTCSTGRLRRSPRARALTGHADLVGRLLLAHHRVERDALWPALGAAVPDERGGQVRAAVADWAVRSARIDAQVRDLATAGRQWAVAGTPAARDVVARACRRLADAVDAHTAAEERDLVPLLDAHLDARRWAAVATAGSSRLTGRERRLVLGLALEDSCAADRARLLEGLPRRQRWAWRLAGARSYRRAVVRLRGEPPAA